MPHSELNIPHLQHNVELAPFTTYQIGGQADLFVEVHSGAELAHAVTTARAADLPYFVLGTGANILVSDAGFRGLVIHNKAERHQIHGRRLTVESGATIAYLIGLTLGAKLSGLEHFILIPSSVGGAVWQNLHFLAPDRKSTLYIGDRVVAAKVLLSDGRVDDVDGGWFEFGYDDSKLHHEEVVVLEVTFGLDAGNPDVMRGQMEANSKWRREKQPQLDEVASCGSVFRKIEGAGAGRLIDQAGLKGATEGQIMVSPKHANYLVNRGGGTAADVRRLIARIQREVKASTGYELEPEIGFVGDWSDFEKVAK